MRTRSPGKAGTMIAAVVTLLGAFLTGGGFPLSAPLHAQSPTEDRMVVAMGASTRFGDVSQRESLPVACAGGDRRLLIFVNVVGDQRVAWHRNSIDAAVPSGVGHIAYTSFMVLENNASGLAADHRLTERSTCRRAGWRG